MTENMTSTFDIEFDQLLSELWKRTNETPSSACMRKWINRVSSKRSGPVAHLPAGSCRREDSVSACKKPFNSRQPSCPTPSKVPRPKTVSLPSYSGKANPQLLRVLESLGEDATLQRFYRVVAPYTCDRGALLMRLTSDMLSDFRSFVNDVFNNRVTQIGVVLAREQTAIERKYAELESRTLNRAQLALMKVRDSMPTFDWRHYETEPGYIKSVILQALCPDQASEEAEEEDARGKGLLYQLNWLRSEIDRADCENHGLYEQHSTLVAELAAINKKISDVQCRAAGEMAELNAKLDEYKSESADQVATIDKLMETIQIAMQNSKIEPQCT